MKPKYLVRPDDYHIFELDESNHCYRSWTLRSIKNSKGKRPNAKKHFTFENLTKKYNFIPITESELEKYRIKHDKNSDLIINSIGGKCPTYHELFNKVSKYDILSELNSIKEDISNLNERVRNLINNINKSGKYVKNN